MTTKLTVELPAVVVPVTVEFPDPHPPSSTTPKTKPVLTKTRRPFIANLQAADLSATLKVLLAIRPLECKEVPASL